MKLSGADAAAHRNKVWCKRVWAAVSSQPSSKRGFSKHAVEALAHIAWRVGAESCSQPGKSGARRLVPGSVWIRDDPPQGLRDDPPRG